MFFNKAEIEALKKFSPSKKVAQNEDFIKILHAKVDNIESHLEDIYKNVFSEEFKNNGERTKKRVRDFTSTTLEVMRDLQNFLNRKDYKDPGYTRIKAQVNVLKHFADLYNEYKSLSYKDGKDRMAEIVEEITKMKKEFVNAYIEEAIEYLKKSPAKDPAMQFLGSLDYNIDETVTKKYFDKDYPHITERFNNLSHDKIKSMKPIYKKAFDKLYGAGVFEQALANNKRK